MASPSKITNQAASGAGAKGALTSAEKAFQLSLGTLLGLALLKFGNPVVLAKLIDTPRTMDEIIYQPWPAKWGYILAVAVFLLGARTFLSAKRPSRKIGPNIPSTSHPSGTLTPTLSHPMGEGAGKRSAVQGVSAKRLDSGVTPAEPGAQENTASFFKSNWFLAFPIAWFLWQLAAAPFTIDRGLTSITLAHFFFTLLFFFAGYFILKRQRLSWWLIAPIGVFYLYALLQGFGQHYGGLEQMRTQFYETPNWQQLYSPDYVKKIASNRIFSTLVYPNAFAGAILFFLPILLVALFQWGQKWQRTLWGVALGTLAYTSLACLFWTESRGGWLVGMLMIGVALLHLPMSKQRRVIIVFLVLILGATAFGIRFASYFKRGATSAAARIIYWEGAFQTFQSKPMFGTGPGTFGPAFAKVKPPEAEMARLAHNDYLEQASDSGVVGFVTYLVFIVGTFWKSYRSAWSGANPLPKAIWLGTFGWAAQNFLEFGLYIPALAWPAFLFLGWLANEESTGTYEASHVRLPLPSDGRGLG